MNTQNVRDYDDQDYGYGMSGGFEKMGNSRHARGGTSKHADKARTKQLRQARDAKHQLH